MGIFSLAKNGTSTDTDLHIELERLIDNYGNDILRISYMYLKDKHKAEDAFQEVFLRAFKNLRGFKGNSSEKTWLISIAINVCKDYLKSSWSKKVTYLDSYEDSEISSVEDEVIETVERQELINIIMELPPIYKDVILLYYYEDFAVEQIGKTLGIPEGTVRSRLHRAREILKNKIERKTLV